MYARYLSSIFAILVIPYIRNQCYGTLEVKQQNFDGDDGRLNFIESLSKKKSPTHVDPKDENKKWPKGSVPYVISEQFSSEDKTLIENAIQKFESTCVRFEVKRAQDDDYVSVIKGQGCNSPVGRQGSSQNVTLGAGCLYLHTILHELMHAIGFQHEHNRPDRDNFIIIHRENINTGMEYAFKKRSIYEVTDQGFAYDYESVMQYEKTAFSRNGRPTMEAKLTGVKLGSTSGLSKMDVQKINKLYGCEVSQSKINTENVQTSNGNDSL